jgi:Uma2 family endonuclease
MSEMLESKFDKKFIDSRFIQEKINGKIYLMSRPSKRHMRIQGNIYNMFTVYFRQNNKKCEALFETQLDIDEDNYLVPDVMVFCYDNERKDKEDVPLIVVEMLSRSTRKKDLTVKMKKYAEFGIQEYWIVDHQISVLDVYVLKEGRYELEITCGLDDEIAKRDDGENYLVPEFISDIFADLTVKAEEVFFSVL